MDKTGNYSTLNKQLDIPGFSESHLETIPVWQKVDNGEYLYLPSLFTQAESDAYLKCLQNRIAWKQEGMKMYGKELKFPRLTAWYGDEGKIYSYSGITNHPNTWTPEILKIKAKAESLAGMVFNSVLLNLYRDGQDSMSWHQDNEKELGNNPVIASVSFGAERTFYLRHIASGEKIKLALSHGSLLLMGGAMQHYWQHQVPKSKRVSGPRINLTFRVIQ